MLLSLGIGLLMLVIKVSAYRLTGSASILSDAAESVVHIAAVAFAVFSLYLSLKPADQTHLYGHDKISFFSAGFEGAMIIIAAFYIIYETALKWVYGFTPENLGVGTAYIAFAAIVNGGLGGYLLWLGKKQQSIILEANGKHVLTDSWTSLGVLVGLALTLLTGMVFWDSFFAMLVALNILFSGFGLLKKSVSGLMDQADPALQEKLSAILKAETDFTQIDFHELRHRSSGNTIWVEVHLLFPGNMTIQKAHFIATQIENNIADKFSTPIHITTHLEAVDDHDELHQ